MQNQGSSMVNRGSSNAFAKADFEFQYGQQHFYISSAPAWIAAGRNKGSELQRGYVKIEEKSVPETRVGSEHPTHKDSLGSENSARDHSKLEILGDSDRDDDDDDDDDFSVLDVDDNDDRMVLDDYDDAESVVELDFPSVLCQDKSLKGLERKTSRNDSLSSSDFMNEKESKRDLEVLNAADNNSKPSNHSGIGRKTTLLDESVSDNLPSRNSFAHSELPQKDMLISLLSQDQQLKGKIKYCGRNL